MILALCGQKGGSGKTTTAESVCAELLARGKNVLLVDADPQGTAKTWADVAIENKRPCPTVVTMGATMHHANQLPRLAREYDMTLIDCPPRHSDIQRAALMVADLAVLPCGPSAHDAWAMAESVELVNEAARLRPGFRAFILITRKAANTVIGQGARDALTACGIPLLRAELHQRVAYQEAPAYGLGVTQYAPLDAAADEVRALVDELLEVMNGKVKASNRPAKAQARRA